MNRSFIFLKYGLLVFSLLVGIVGVLMFTSVIYLTVSVTQSFNPIWIGFILMWPWIITLATLGLAALGAYGSIREKTEPLRVFYVLMWIITAILAVYGIRIIFEVTSAIQQGLLKPLSIAMGIIFGLASLTFVGGLFAKLLMNQIKQRSHVQTSIWPMDSLPLLTSEC